MKKGCAFILFTIIFLAGVGYYLWQRFGEDIEREAKARIVALAVENLNEKIVGINPEINADSLQNIITDFFIKTSRDINTEELENFIGTLVDDLKTAIDESESTSLDYSKLEDILDNYEK